METEINIKLHIGDTLSREQIIKEIFEIKMLMLQIEDPQEQRRLSNCIRTMKKLLKTK